MGWFSSKKSAQEKLDDLADEVGAAGSRQQKCSQCGLPGHNVRTHNKLESLMRAMVELQAQLDLERANHDFESAAHAREVGALRSQYEAVIARLTAENHQLRARVSELEVRMGMRAFDPDSWK